MKQTKAMLIIENEKLKAENKRLQKIVDYYEQQDREMAEIEQHAIEEFGLPKLKEVTC